MSALTQRCKALFGYMDQLVHRIPSVPRDILTTALLLYAAYWTSGILISHTGGENNSALVFVLAVVCISFFTTGYAYGITASIIGTFCINYFFMVPYSAFSLSHTGYPVAMLSMVAISCIVCALTSRVKQQAIEAVRREKNTKTLYEMNEKLNAEKAAIQLQSARETIRGNILRAVSHDLRTPLTAIKGWSETLRQGGAADEELMNKGLEVISSEAERLSGIVEELLDFSRMQGGHMTMRFGRMDVLAELEEAVVLFRERAKREDIDLVYIEGENLSPITGDKDRLKQVFINIIDNAIKYSNAGGRVRIEAVQMGGNVQIVISDSGVGIPKSDLPNIKNKFYKANRTRPGSGIGLALADEIIRRHKGRLEIDSEEGVGTTVTITLPTAEPG